MAALVIVVAGFRAAQSLVVPFLIAAFLAMLCAPSLAWLQEKGVPTLLALLLVIGAASVIFMCVVALAGSSINDFARNIDVYQDELVKKKQGLLAWLDDKGMPVPEQISQGGFDPMQMLPYIQGLLSSLASILSNAFLVLLTLIFILLEASGFPKKLIALSGGKSGSLQRAGEIGTAVRHYVTIKTWLSLATALLVWGWLWFLGVDYALLWGLLAFFFNFVPNIGSIIAAVPAVMLALVQPGGGPSEAMYAAIGYVVINVLVGNVIEPRVMGRGLGLSTLVVFASLVFWGWVLGPVGMLLSVPLTMIVKIVLEASDETRPLAILLGSDSEV